MGSHYIPVGKLKIDKSILDLVCPAAGYDSTPPPPEIYCPANNYYIPSEPVFPDDGAPEVTPPVQGGDDEIIFIVSNHIPIEFKWNLNRSSGNLKWEIYGKNDVSLDSGTQAANQFAYHFYKLDNGYSGGDGAMFFKVHFTCVTNGAYFTHCTTGGATSVFPVIKAWLNTPQLTNLDFRLSKLFTELWMCDIMDQLGGSVQLADTISLKKLKLPTSAATWENADNMLLRSGIEEVVFPKTTNISTLQSALSYSKVKKITFPDTISQDANTIYLNNLVASCDYLEEITIPYFTPQKIRINLAFSNCPRLKKINLHPDLLIDDFSDALTNSSLGTFQDDEFVVNNVSSFILRTNLFTNNFKVKKVKFLNDNTYANSYFLSFQNCVVEEVVHPEKYTVTNNGASLIMASLKKVTMPKEIDGFVTPVNFPYLNCPNIEVLTKVDDLKGAVFTNGITCPVKLKVFDQPEFITKANAGVNCSGTSSAPRNLEYFDINWSDSVTNGLKNIYLAYNNLSKAEIERIFTALPAVGAGYTINVRDNPGYATCDKSIATAKGWTVS